MKRIRLCLTLTFITFFLFSQSAFSLSIVVKVGVCKSLPPYQYVDNQGTIRGLHVDIFDHIASNNGLLVEYIAFENTNDAILALEEKEVDAVLGVHSIKYQNRSVRFTDDINTATLCLVAKNDVAEIYRKDGVKKKWTVSLEGDTFSRYLSGNDFKSVIMKDNQESAFEMLNLGYSDMLIGVKDVVIFQLQEKRLEEEYSIVANYISTVNYSIATQKNDKYLLDTINQGLSRLRTTGTYEDLYNKYGLVDNTGLLVERLKRILFVFILALVAIATYSLVSRKLRKRLEWEVVVRTNDLKEANKTVKTVNAQLERKIVQAEEYSNLLNEIIESSPIAMLLMDNDWKIVHSNNHARKMKLFNPRFYQYFVGEQNFEEIVQKAMMLSSEASSFGIVTRGQNEPGQQSFRYSIHRVESSTIAGLLLTFEDITEEIIAQDAEYEKRKNEALNKMIASIAHEIKNPLTSINAAVGMVYDRRNDLSFLETFEEIVPKEINRINRLVQNLVYYAKPPRSSLEEVDIGLLVTSIKKLMEPLGRRQRIDLDFQSERDLFVHANKDKLNQIIINLVINSLESINERIPNEKEDYMPCVELRTHRMDRYISISIWDNGTGMSQDQSSPISGVNSLRLM